MKSVFMSVVVLALFWGFSTQGFADDDDAQRITALAAQDVAQNKRADAEIQAAKLLVQMLPSGQIIGTKCIVEKAWDDGSMVIVRINRKGTFYTSTIIHDGLRVGAPTSDIAGNRFFQIWNSDNIQNRFWLKFYTSGAVLPLEFYGERLGCGGPISCFWSSVSCK